MRTVQLIWLSAQKLLMERTVGESLVNSQSGAVITECAFHGDISYRDSRGYSGGICGYASRSTIINCETTGSVRVRDERNIQRSKDYDGRFLYG